MIALLIASIGGLVALYLTRPHFREVKVSSARFFEETPDAKNKTTQFRLTNLLLSRPFYLQLAVLLCVLLALLLANQQVASEGVSSIGVWVAVDASASMSASDNMDAARAETAALRSHLTGLDAAVCVTVSRFHLDNVTLIANAAPDAIPAQIGAVTPQPLGTDVGLVRSLTSQLAAQPEDTDCFITHLVILTDQPAPAWVDDYDGLPRLLWRSVGTPQPNAGITSVRRIGGGALGWNGALAVDLAGYDRSPGTSVQLLDANGALITEETIIPDAENRARVTFELPGGGDYTVALTETDDYVYDDRVTISTEPPLAIRVDWRLPDRSLPDALGWTHDANTPDLIVLPSGEAIPSGDVPVLLVGDSYGTAVAPAEIAVFDDTASLLDGLNFDVAERAAISGVPESVLDSMRPVLRDTNDGVWVAIASDPARAYVPGLPQNGGDENITAFSTTLFFNALRWLMGQREMSPLYTLTTPAEPTIDGTRTALHPGEGDTAQARRSIGELSDIDASIERTQQEPVWFLPLVVAAMLLTLERFLSVFGSARWRTG